MVSIIIGGDIVPQNYILEQAHIGIQVDKSIINYLEDADFRVFNLETPLTNAKKPILKQGNNFKSSPEVVYDLRKLKVNLVSLANNHALDYGEEGLIDTIKTLNNVGIEQLGGGVCALAAKPYIFKKDGFSIGIYACTENEFSSATDKRAGANPFDPFESLDHIYNLKQNCDKVIVLYHGGKEYYPYPSPLLQKTCRKMAEKGADLVICNHSHIIGCEEDYIDSRIVYGIGDFYSSRSATVSENTGLLIKTNFGTDGQNDYSYMTVSYNDKSKTITKAENQDNIIHEFIKRSCQILQNGFINESYREFAKSMESYYLNILFGSNKLIKNIDQRIIGGKMGKWWYNYKKRVAIQNVIECEAHRELILVALKDIR